VILGKVADLRLVSPGNLASVGFQVPGRDLEERRLSQAVRADDRQPLPSPDDQRDALEHLLLPVGLRDAVDREDVLAARTLRRDVKEGSPSRGDLPLADLDLLDLLQPALRLAGLGGLRAEALHPGSLLGDRGLRAADLCLVPLLYGGFLDDKGSVVSRVVGDRLVVDVENVRDHGVEEPLVVRNDESAAGVSAEELLEPADGENVEVVRGLVQEEDVGAADQDLREENPQLEPAREGRERRAVRADGDAEPFEDGARPGFEGVAVVGRDAILELGDARGVGFVGLHQRVLLPLRLRDDDVSRHRHVEDGLGVAHEAVLPEDAHTCGLRDRDVSGGRRLVSRDDRQERRLA
jgi:hypothetical protein